MSCRFCEQSNAGRIEPAFDILRKMIELHKAGINADIETVAISGSTEFGGEIPAFKIRLYSGVVDIVRFIPQYNAPFIETVIDAMLQDFKKGVKHEL